MASASAPGSMCVYVDIVVAGDVCRRMRADNRHRHALRKENRRGSVTEIVQPDFLRQASLFGERVEPN